MKTFICFALFIAAASAGIIGAPIATSQLGLAGISPLGLGLAGGPLVSRIGLGPQLIQSGPIGLGATRIISGGLPLSAGLPWGAGLPLSAGLPLRAGVPINAGLAVNGLPLASPWGLGSPLGLGGISTLNGGLLIKK